MSGIDDRHSSSDGPHLPEAASHGFLYAATHFLIGVISLAVITFIAFRLHLQPGSGSLVFLIVVVFVFLRTGIVSAAAVSLVAVFFLYFHVLSLVPSPSGTRISLPPVAVLAFCLNRWY